MSKTKRIVKKEKQEKKNFISGLNIEKMIPLKYQWIFSLTVLIIFYVVFFYPIFLEGKTFQSGDIITALSYQPYIAKGGYPLWNPYVFCGIPASAVVGPYRWFEFISAFYSIIKEIISTFFIAPYNGNLFLLFVLSLTSYFLARKQRLSLLTSLLVSIATSFSTGILLFLYIGHVSKLAALGSFPLIFYVLFRFQEKIRLLDVLILLIALHLLIVTMHVQIIFYVLFSIALYYIFFFVKEVLQKNNLFKSQILKSALTFFAAIIISCLMTFDDLAQIYEYAPYSTRGALGIQEKSTQIDDKSSSDFYQYATNWSFSPEEVVTFLLPSYYGFGNSVYDGPLSENKPVEVNTYFGQMPFVDVPMYMGSIVFILGLFAIYLRRKEPFIQFLTFLIIVSLFISFGRTFPPLFDMLFYYFPFFNKFRTPSMILVVLQIVFPLLLGLGVQKLISLKNENDLKIKNLLLKIAIVFSVLFISFLFLSTPISSWFQNRVMNSGLNSKQLEPLLGYISKMFISDSLIALGLLSATFLLLFFYFSNKFSTDFMVIALILLVTFDLWRIDWRAAKFVENPGNKNYFNKPEYLKAISQLNDKVPFRILNLKQDSSPGSFNQNQNYHAYFLIEDFYGYSGVKPRTYQDLIDVAGIVNQTVWRMLNVKYIILDKKVSYPGLQMVWSNEKEFVYQNSNVLDRFYFVNKLEQKSSIEILNAIKANSFDPQNIAYMEETVPTVLPADSTSKIELKHFQDELIELQTQNSGANFLFIGNTYYPIGWKAFIDDKETKIFKANYGFSGMVIPRGNHTITLSYLPKSYTTGKILGILLHGIVILAFLSLIVYQKRKNS